MSRQSEREDFLVAMKGEGMPIEVARKILRHAKTLHRTAEMECNGTYPEGHDWDAADEVRLCPCLLCKSGRSAEQSIRNLTRDFGIKPKFNGDPRGAVVRLHVPSGRDESWGGVAVP